MSRMEQEQVIEMLQNDYEEGEYEVQQAFELQYWPGESHWYLLNKNSNRVYRVVQHHSDNHYYVHTKEYNK